MFVTIDFCPRSIFKRSMSDGNILRESSSPMSGTNIKQGNFPNSGLPDPLQGERKILCESSPEISTCESDIAYSRFANPSIFVDQLMSNGLI